MHRSDVARGSAAALEEQVPGYLRMGVPVVWIFNPQREIAYVLREGDFLRGEARALRLDVLPIELDVE